MSDSNQASSGRPDHDALLSEINAHIPPGFDWAKGAATYLAKLSKAAADPAAINLFHMTKPFGGGPDYTAFYTEMFAFLGVIKRLNLPPKSRILDVGCGSGWASHFCAKLGYTVHGVDISGDLLDLARQRLKSDPFPPYAGQPFAATFSRVDIERSDVDSTEPFDACLFFSSLRHFLNPIAALSNARKKLKPDGLIAIIEGAANLRTGIMDEKTQQLMRDFQILDRPYSAEQLARILCAADLPHYRFFYPAGGLIDPQVDEFAGLVQEIFSNVGLNYVLASPTEAGLRRVCKSSTDNITFLEGAYGEEKNAEGNRYRWCQPRCHIAIRHGTQASLTLDNWSLPDERQQRIYVEHRGKILATVELPAEVPPVIHFGKELGGEIVRLTSDFCVSPLWEGKEDRRLLSFIASGYGSTR